MHVKLGQFVFEDKKSVFFLEHPSVHVHDVFELFWRSVELLKFHGWNQLSSTAAETEAHVNWDQLEKAFDSFREKQKSLKKAKINFREKQNKFQRSKKRFHRKANWKFMQN